MIKIGLDSPYFLEVFKKYHPSSYSEDLCWDKIGEVFNKAKREFEEVIKEDNTLVVEAYLGKASACVEMGDYEEALPAFNEAIKLMEKGGFDNEMNPFWEVMSDLFCGMADKVMRRKLDPPEGKNHDEWAKKVIEIFKNWRESWLEKKISEEIDFQKSEELRTKKFSNFFELARFYNRHHQKTEAVREYQTVTALAKEKGWELWKYPGTIEEIESGYEVLEKVSFVIGDKETDKEELVNEFKKPVEVKFFRDNDWMKCKYLEFSFLPSGCWVEFKDDISGECSGELVLCLERQSNPTCEITFPSIAIKKEDRLPFYVRIDGKAEILPTSFEIMFEKGDVRKYPGMEEEYELKKDENNEHTIIQTIKKRKGEGERIIEEVMQEKFRKNKRFTSKITISPFAGEKLEIIKATWPISKEKNWDRWTTGLFILPVFFLR